jgi:hypothetical protein
VAGIGPSRGTRFSNSEGISTNDPKVLSKRNNCLIKGRGRERGRRREGEKKKKKKKR